MKGLADIRLAHRVKNHLFVLDWPAVQYHDRQRRRPLRRMIFRLLTGFLRKHGRTLNEVLERSSNTNLREINPPVSTEF
jgi:hypothetical protein